MENLEYFSPFILCIRKYRVHTFVSKYIDKLSSPRYNYN